MVCIGPEMKAKLGVRIDVTMSNVQKAICEISVFSERYCMSSWAKARRFGMALVCYYAEGDTRRVKFFWEGLSDYYCLISASGD
jgi:hypothetical protein